MQFIPPSLLQLAAREISITEVPETLHHLIIENEPCPYKHTHYQEMDHLHTHYCTKKNPMCRAALITLGLKDEMRREMEQRQQVYEQRQQVYAQRERQRQRVHQAQIDRLNQENHELETIFNDFKPFLTVEQKNDLSEDKLIQSSRLCNPPTRKELYHLWLYNQFLIRRNTRLMDILYD